MRLSEQLGFGPKPYLFPRSTDTEHDTDLTRWTIVGPMALNAWLKETFDRKRSLTGIYEAFTKRGEPWLEHVLEGIEFVGRMDVADRASNGLRLAVTRDRRDTNQDSAFGTMLKRAFDNPALSDHNHEHSRRLERWLETMMLNIGELRHSHSIFHWIDSTILFSYWHDADQLISLQRIEEEGHEYSVKKGHSLAGAVMLLALHERYAIERKVSVHDAWEICAGAALMSLKHDEPERFMQAMSGTQNAFTVIAGVRHSLKGDVLEKLYDNNELNIFTLTPGQLVELLRRIKKKNGFMGEGSGSIYGLLPAFEKEYAQELKELKANDRPIVENITDEEKRSFRLAATASVMADVFDMVTPPVEALFRTMNTQYSRFRPFFMPAPIDLMMQYITHEAGNVPSDIDSDTRRILWELMNLEHLQDSVVTDSRLVRGVIRDSAIMGALAFRGIGSRLMQGDISDITYVYQKRKELLVQKALNKANIPLIDRWLLTRDYRAKKDAALITEKIARQGGETQARMLRDKFIQLDTESATIITSLANKPGQDGMKIYSDEQILQFQHLCDLVIGELMKKYDVNEKRLKRYRSKLARGEYPGVTPYTTYDSLGGTPRTLVEPIN
ncbi:MAG: hypothetical protein Q8L37_06240 [Candidatus Gottesmanbacteria bacterium]|nr:hypothetical protein [Candidatus Gottesmanbacteria bacterium]